MPGKHRGAVTALMHKGDEILSVGEDGFLEIWDIRSAAAKERFQISPYRISAMSLHPLKNEMCVIENDDMGLYRISAWDFEKQEKLFSLRFSDTVSYINYSAGGSFIIAGRSGRAGLTLLDAASGDTLQSPETLAGTVGFAATGRAERNMLVYLSAGGFDAEGGLISYRDLVSDDETNRFEAPGNVSNVIVCGNNRYLAGIDADGLVVFDAASGAVLGRDSSIGRAALLCPAGDEFYCLTQGELYRFAVDRSGRLSVRERTKLSIGAASITSMAANGYIAFGTANGEVLLPERNGHIITMAHNDQLRIIEIDVSRSSIAFLTENKTLGFLPLDYSHITENEEIITEAQYDAYSRLTPFNASAAGESNAADDAAQFILWQDSSAGVYPVIVSAGRAPLPLSEMTFRPPLRSVSSIDGKILFLDSAGNISVYTHNGKEKTRPLSFSSVGAIYAAFIDSDNFILCRSAISGNTPFLMVSIVTGETVPLPWPSQAGIQVYRGGSGAIYVAAVNQDAAGIQTSIIRLNTAAPAQSAPLVKFQGEDTQFSLTESAGLLAATLGGEGAAIYSGENIRPFERTAGLPVQLKSGDQYFVLLDEEGNICWFDHDGKLLAIFKMYADGWKLSRFQN
ncbi:hypothetical protein AGMMS50293_19050 [Spirochaetia bacterium]|nr:hypothetical protein AGMMS50293_19050 [Spirochaetia bacterium]